VEPEHSEEVAPTAARRQHSDTDTASQILDVAERLAQRRGFNGFSYADIADELHITKPALHYHFASKAILGEALIRRYAAWFAEALTAVDTDLADAPAKLEAYADLYLDVLRNQRMCLCGMLASEYQTLPEPIQRAVIRFFDDNEAWLEGVLEQGQREGSLHVPGSRSEAARTIVSALEGAMLVARPYGDVARFQAAATRLLEGLASPQRAEAAGRR
jgi:TetR/AcrR family transcriptional repressor of nem operon